MATPDRMILLDACCLINLYATRHIGEILAAQPLPVGIVEIALREARYVERGGEGEDAHERDPIETDPLVADAVLRVVSDTSDQEYQAFVDYAASNLDDGEAMTLAVAEVRGWEVATDERRARRVAAEAAPGLVRHSTVSMLRCWVRHRGVDAEVLRASILAIEQRARYRPRRQDTDDWNWWQAALAAEEADPDSTA